MESVRTLQALGKSSKWTWLAVHSSGVTPIPLPGGVIEVQMPLPSPVCFQGSSHPSKQGRVLLGHEHGFSGCDRTGGLVVVPS